MKHNTFFSPFGDWERCALLELYTEYSHSLRERRLKLKPVAIELSDSTSFWGKWERGVRTIYISRRLLREQPWYHVLAVLRHEMAHQLVDENLGTPEDGKVHGKVFQEACRRLGIPEQFTKSSINFQQDSLDWRETSRDDVSEKMLEKVRKLLNLATSSNEHEALLAMNRVREIYARYNLEQTAASTKPEFVHLVISTGRKRLQTQEQKVIGILVGHFFVQVIAGRTYDVKTGEHYRLIEIIGSKENVLMAEYVYHFLIKQSKQLVEQMTATTKMNPMSRKSYHLGILEGFDEKLSCTNTPMEEESAISKALVLFQKDGRLTSYISTIYPRLGRLTSQARLRDGSAFNAGKKVGRQITLKKPIHNQGTKGLIRLLTGL